MLRQIAVRALVAMALLAAACNTAALQLGGDASGAVDLAGVDLGGLDLTARAIDGSVACAQTTCAPGQTCVHPDCCVECRDYVAHDVDGGGICPPGWVPAGSGGFATRCSNIAVPGPCAMPCTPDPEFCVDSPLGCQALDPNQYCSDKGQEGGFCGGGTRDLYCIVCF